MAGGVPADGVEDFGVVEAVLLLQQLGAYGAVEQDGGAAFQVDGGQGELVGEAEHFFLFEGAGDVVGEDAQFGAGFVDGVPLGEGQAYVAGAVDVGLEFGGEGL